MAMCPASRSTTSAPGMLAIIWSWVSHDDGGVLGQADIRAGDGSAEPGQIGRLREDRACFGHHAGEGGSRLVLVHVVAEHDPGEVGVEHPLSVDRRLPDLIGDLGDRRTEPTQDLAQRGAVGRDRAGDERQPSQPVRDARRPPRGG